MVRTHPRRATALTAFIIVLASASACGSSDPNADKGGGGANATADSGDGTSSPARSGAGETTGGGRSSCVNDGKRLSQSSTVVWTADSLSEHKGSEATPRTTMLLGADGVLVPSKLTVKVGEVFTFGLAANNKEIAAIGVGCATAQTVYTGPALAAQYITTPGSYDIVNELGKTKLGTITIE